MRKKRRRPAVSACCFSSFRHILSFLIPRDGPTKMPPHATFKTRLSAHTFTNFVTQLSPSQPLYNQTERKGWLGMIDVRADGSTLITPF